MKHLFIVSTRPDIIKVAPVVKLLGGYVVHTGQHAELADGALESFDIKPDLELRLMKKGQEPPDFISRAVPKLVDVIHKVDPEYIWVHGDTMSAFAGATASKLTITNAQKKLVHLEAGLRSGDPMHPYPEELMRVLIDHMADIHFCPTDRDKDNLKKEGITSGIIVGNTIVDALERIKPTLSDESPVGKPYILATIHRREAQGYPMTQIFEALKELQEDYKVIIPLHPNPKIRNLADGIGLEYIEPVSYEEFLLYLKHCSVVITDSGGIQEEAPSFGKPVIVCRKTTERPQYQFSELVWHDKDKIVQKAKQYLQTNITVTDNPFGDGYAVHKIIDSL